MKKQIVLALVLSMLSMTSCARKTVVVKGNDNKSTVTTATVEPVISPNNSTEKIDLSTLSKTSNGYGQGVIVDEQNRTAGALDFNANYGSLNATAIDENSDKITLTFDQGYENGYTAQILDTLKEKKVKAVFFFYRIMLKKILNLFRE